MATIIIPTPLRKFTGNQSTFKVNEAGTISEAILSLTNQYTDLKKHVIDDQGKIRSFVRLYLGDEDVSALDQKADTRIKESDVISIVPAIAGGIY
ncbi:MAG: MoaD/ThiS family protein [Saprospiraceae bacterium]|nr:MoaD/ThiS family protein [Saprospiraceae bacterium]